MKACSDFGFNEQLHVKHTTVVIPLSQFASLVNSATVQAAASTVTTAILLPLYIGFLVKRLEQKGFKFENGETLKKTSLGE